MLKDKTDCSCLVIEVMEDELPFLLHGKQKYIKNKFISSSKR